jgi:hypothetical protein
MHMSKQHRSSRIVLCAAGVLLAVAGTTRAQLAASQPATGPAPATAPATAPAAAGDRSAAVVITAVEGMARARTGPNAKWQLAAKGMRLPVGAEIGTGPKARVTCTIPPGEDFVIDRMSNVTVAEAQRTGNRQQTRLVMQYGRTAARVQAAGIEHDMRIDTPVTTASVKGTEYTVDDQPPFAPELRTYNGLVDYRFAKRQLFVGKGGRSQGGRGTAETALLESVVDPSTPRVRTSADATLIANETSRGAVVRYNQDIQLNEVHGGAGPQSDADLANSLPGRLNFVLRWKQNVDVDIFVTVQPGDQLNTILTGTFNPSTFLFPGNGLQTSPTGGQIAFNHRGGANGGQEICFWPEAFPTAVYGFSALNNSSTDPATIKFNAYLDGQKISLFTFAEDGFTLIRAKGIQRTAPAAGTQSVIVLAPPNDVFEGFPESPDETLDPQVGGAPGASAPVKAMKAAAKQAAAKQATAKAGKPAKATKPVRADRRGRQPQNAPVAAPAGPAARNR